MESHSCLRGKLSDLVGPLQYGLVDCGLELLEDDVGESLNTEEINRKVMKLVY